MSRILADMVNYGKQYLRQKSALFFTFLFPILLVLVFGAIFSAPGASKVNLHVQNLDDGPYSQAFLNVLNQSDLVTVEMVPQDVNLTDFINEKSLSLALLIPDNFSSNVQRILESNTSMHEHANLTIYGDPSQSTFGAAMAYVSQAETFMNYQIAKAHPLLSIETRAVGSSEFTTMDYFLPGVVGMTVMTNAMYSMTSICAEYKSKGYAKLLATTTLTKQEWLVSRIVLNSLLMTASLLTTTIIGWFVLGLHVTLTPMAFVFIPAGAFLFTSAGMLLGTLGKDPESAQAIANVIGFPMMFLSGSFFPLDMMPGFMKEIAQALPLTYMNNGLRDTMLFGNNISALVNLGVIVGIGVVMFVAGSRLLSWKEK